MFVRFPVEQRVVQRVVDHIRARQPLLDYFPEANATSGTVLSPSTRSAQSFRSSPVPASITSFNL